MSAMKVMNNHSFHPTVSKHAILVAGTLVTPVRERSSLCFQFQLPSHETPCFEAHDPQRPGEAHHCKHGDMILCNLEARRMTSQWLPHWSLHNDL